VPGANQGPGEDVTRGAGGVHEAAAGVPAGEGEPIQGTLFARKDIDDLKGSKVADKSGKPRLVYHGTTNAFDKFKRPNTGIEGIFFTESPEVASHYAGVNAATGELGEDLDVSKSSGPNIRPALLNIQRPLKLSPGEYLFGVTHSGLLVAEAEEKGYDGLHITADPELDSLFSADSWAVFHPYQIKSPFEISGQMKAEVGKPEQESLPLEKPKPPKQLTGPARGATTPLIKTPLVLEGTGEGGRTTVLDLAGALNEWSKVGLKPKKEIRIAMDRAKAELKYQLAQTQGGLDWYKKDTKDAINTLQDNGFPELASETQNKLFRTLWGITSYGVDPDVNLTSAAEAWKAYKKTGEFPLKTDSKTNWPGYSGIKDSLHTLNNLISEKGEQGAVDWLLSKHPVSEIREQKLKTHESATRITGKATDEKYGAFIFGPKAGAYTLNLQGITDHTTVDIWGARMIRRWTGTLTPENVSDPVTTEEARNFHNIVETLSKQFGLDISDTQAVLWSYEHDLYEAHGVGEKAKSYKGASERYVQRQQEGSTREYLREQSDLFSQGYGAKSGAPEKRGTNAAPGGRAKSGQERGIKDLSPGLKGLISPGPKAKT
jgi:hypothetical protein